MRSNPPLGGRMSDRRPAVSAFARVACPSARFVRLFCATAMFVAANTNLISGTLTVHDLFSFYESHSAPSPGQDGRLYGIAHFTQTPDWIYDDVVWRMNHDGTQLEYLHSFENVLEGFNLSGPPLRGADGILYGANEEGGIHESGTLWRLRSDGTDFKVLWMFRRELDGWLPRTPIFGPDGRLYGTTIAGGQGVEIRDDNDASGYGTFWRINPDGTGFATLHYFNPAVDGDGPWALTLGPDGKFYGVDRKSTIWRINMDGSGYQQLRRFAPMDVGYRPTGLVIGGDGMLYGSSVTDPAGPNGGGVIWRMRLDGAEFRVLRILDNHTRYTNSLAPVFGADGKLYGSTEDGGSHNAGSLWRMNPDGSDFTSLHEFDLATGVSLPTTPQFAADGRLWGRTRRGGRNGTGAFYAWSPDPTLQSFGNGSFESGFTGWLATGNQRLSSAASHATDGTRAVVFNAGNTAPNGSVSKTFATLAGQAYVLRFDAGVLAYNRNSQRLEVTARGDSPLLSQVVSLTGLGGGAIRWSAQNIPFFADSTATTLVFRDISTTSNGLDLLLDHVRLEPAAAPSLTNGSFESGYTGWSTSGHQTVVTNATQATDGTKLVVFNNGNTAPNGVLAQSFATTPGQLCTLRFDVGVLAYNRNIQRLQVTATGNSALWSQVISVTGAGGGTVRWTPQTHSFVPDSPSTTLTFRDISSTTNALDLLLDHVRIE
jgi:uncharacterized repeat protein (TIGR03803 family)